MSKSKKPNVSSHSNDNNSSESMKPSQATTSSTTGTSGWASGMVGGAASLSASSVGASTVSTPSHSATATGASGDSTSRTPSHGLSGASKIPCCKIPKAANANSAAIGCCCPVVDAAGSDDTGDTDDTAELDRDRVQRDELDVHGEEARFILHTERLD